MIERTDKYSIFVIRDKKDRFENVKFMSILKVNCFGKMSKFSSVWYKICESAHFRGTCRFYSFTLIEVNRS